MSVQIKATIAVATTSDAPEIQSLIERTWPVTYISQEYDITEADVTAYLRQHGAQAEISGLRENLSNLRKKAWVARVDGQMVGSCIAHKEEIANRLSGTYVLAQYQAMGIGRQLVEQALAWLGDDKDITLGVATYTPAVDFYRQLGFNVKGPLPNNRVIKFPSGKHMPEYEMIRKAK